jgi:hypothetical protein
MDPIHPIVPQAPHIAPVTPAPGAGRVQQRDERRRQAAARHRQTDERRRDQQREPDGQYRDADELDGSDDDGHPHVDVTV